MTKGCQMKSSTRVRAVAAGGALLVAGFGAGALFGLTGLASADTTNNGSPTAGYHHGGPGGPRGCAGTPVTGAELGKVKAAVEAKRPGVSVLHVRKDPDGSYDVMGTKNGALVMLQVSKDLSTVSERTGGPQQQPPTA